MEILFASITNIITLAQIVAFGSTIIAGLFIAVKLDGLRDEDPDNKKEPVAKMVKKAIFIPIVSAIISCIPTIDDLWKVRIGLIKLELSNKENLSKAAETIEQIGKKLECKYLGCKSE